MPTKLPPRMLRSMRVWYRNRAKHRAELMATDDLYRESDSILSDIGLSRSGVKGTRSGPPGI